MNDAVFKPNVRRLVTHSGRFHADDVFAAAVLRTIYPAATLDRTRVESELADALSSADTVVFDVGHRFGPSRLNFDHHQWVLRLRVDSAQDEHPQARRQNEVPYASFGLIWRAFGRWYAETVTATSDEIQRQWVVEQVDLTLVQGIDAADCGALELASHLRLRPELSLQPMSVGELVADMNPEPFSEQDALASFERAMVWADTILRARTHACARSWQAREAVRAADDGSAVLTLDRAFEWRGSTLNHHRFVVFPESGRDSWLVQSIASQDDPFSPMVPFPLEWAGLRDGGLRDASGVADAEFCHAGRFIAGARSRDGACDLARLALQNSTVVAARQV
jgi:uncharacterized UPF0160 family protein